MIETFRENHRKLIMHFRLLSSFIITRLLMHWCLSNSFRLCLLCMDQSITEVNSFHFEEPRRIYQRITCLQFTFLHYSLLLILIQNHLWVPLYQSKSACTLHWQCLTNPGVRRLWILNIIIKKSFFCSHHWSWWISLKDQH